MESESPGIDMSPVSTLQTKVAMAVKEDVPWREWTGQATLVPTTR
jgi:hypothetical protein